MTQEQQGKGDALWDEFVRTEPNGKGIRELSAAERADAAERAGAARAPRRPWRRWAAVGGAAVTVLAVMAGVGVWQSSSKNSANSSPGPSASAHASAARSTAAAAKRMVTEDQAFPARIAGFTKVKQSGGPNCTGSGMVGPNLTSMIDQSKGCRGVIGALYEDAQKNEFTIVIFGMETAEDVAHIVTVLSMNPMDYEVGVLQPPAGSGLTALPADSGLVQAFAGTRGLVVAGLAQWSDGRAVDFQKLTDKLQPLMTAVTKQADAHDQG